MNSRQQGELNWQLLRDFFAVLEDWIDVKTLANATGLHVNSVKVHADHLIRIGYLDEKLIKKEWTTNNSSREIIHYRLATSVKSRDRC